MKNFLSTVILLFLFLFLACLDVSAKTTPLYKNSIAVEGIGIIKLPEKFSVYEKPNFKSKVLKSYSWGKDAGAYIKADDDDDFIIYYPAQSAAFMTVVDDLEDSPWYKVCYDQKNKLTGWVSPDKYEFYNWLSFFTKYGKANGLYAFKDLDLKEKRLYSKDSLDSQILSSFERAKNIRVHIFRGNWVLVRVYDYEGGLKIGWLKWRTDEGKFNFFPNILK